VIAARGKYVIVHNQWTKQRAGVAGDMRRFEGDPLRLIQCAEYLEYVPGILWNSYSTCCWQDDTLRAAKSVAVGTAGAIDNLGRLSDPWIYPEEVTMNGDRFDKAPLQYIESHDHSRFLTNFGTLATDEIADPLFLDGDRSRWYKLQPYLIWLMTAKGLPMLWQGQEFGESYSLPRQGLAKVALLRPVRWDLFYDTPGRILVTLTRKLLALRGSMDQLRRGDIHFYNDPAMYQSRGVMLIHRSLGDAWTLVAINFADTDAVVPFRFPTEGYYLEKLSDGDAIEVNTFGEFKQLTVPSNYGRIWTKSS